MNECVFIYRTYHIVSQGGLQFFLSEIGRQVDGHGKIQERDNSLASHPVLYNIVQLVSESVDRQL